MFIYGSELHRAALTTDHAWSVELIRCFGKNAGDARYRPEGRGVPGSALRAAYDARTAAQEACRLVYPIAPLSRSHLCKAPDYRVEIVQ